MFAERFSANEARPNLLRQREPVWPTDNIRVCTALFKDMYLYVISLRKNEKLVFFVRWSCFLSSKLSSLSLTTFCVSLSLSLFDWCYKNTGSFHIDGVLVKNVYVHIVVRRKNSYSFDNARSQFTRTIIILLCSRSNYARGTCTHTYICNYVRAEENVVRTHIACIMPQI